MEAIIDGWSANFSPAKVQIYIKVFALAEYIDDFLGTDSHFSRQTLKVEGTVRVTEQFARQTFNAVAVARAKMPLSGARFHPQIYRFQLRQAQQGLVSAIAKRDLLMRLDQARALPFRLHYVIQELAVTSAVPIVQKRKADEEAGRDGGKKMRYD